VYRTVAVSSVLGILLLCVSGALFGSCTNSQNTLPKDWPIPQLTFTGNVTVTRAAPHGAKLPAMPAAGLLERETWLADVHCDGGKDVMLAEVETCLAPIGYRRGFAGDFNTESAQFYFSKDGLVMVYIYDKDSGIDFSVEIQTTKKPSSDYEMYVTGYRGHKLEPLSP
jgi:hypothetical protein